MSRAHVLTASILLAACGEPRPSDVSATIHFPIAIDALGDPDEHGWYKTQAKPADESGAEWGTFRDEVKKKCGGEPEGVVLENMGIYLDKGSLPFREWDFNLLAIKDDGTDTWAMVNPFVRDDVKVDTASPVRQIQKLVREAMHWKRAGITLFYKPTKSMTVPLRLEVKANVRAICKK